MNHITGLLPCFNSRARVYTSHFNLGYLIEKVVNAVTEIFRVITALAAIVVTRAMDAVMWVATLILGALCRSNPYARMVINNTALTKAPEPFDWNALIAANGTIHSREIITEYERIFGAGAQGADKTRLESLLREANHQSNDRYDQMYHEILTAIIKNVIIELRNPDIDIAKKKRALQGIIDGQGDCRPRRLEECQRQFRLLKSSGTAAEQMLLEHVQFVKEEIFLEQFQNDQFHMLNYIRSRVGHEFGLDVSDINLQDPNRTYGGNHPSDSTLRSVFFREYTPQKVIQAVLARILVDGNGNVFGPYILEQLEAQALEDGEDVNDNEVATRIEETGLSFYETDGTREINEAGVAFLLERIGILRRV